MNRLRPGLVLLVLTLAGIACLGTGTPRIDAVVHNYPLPDGYYGGGIAWLEEDYFVVDYTLGEPGIYGFPAMIWGLWSMSASGTDLTPLNVPAAHGPCYITYLRGPQRLPDGRLGYFEKCDVEVTGSTQWVMAYDPQTGEVEQLLDYPYTSDGIGIGGLSWKSDMSAALASDGIGVLLSERIALFEREDWEYLDIDFGVSYGPAWSPDDQRIAFLGRGASFDSPYALASDDVNMYVVDADNLQAPTMVLEDIWSSGPTWTPDGNGLIFSGTVRDTDGLFLFDLVSDDLYLILDRHVTTPVWSPDFQHIAMIAVPERESGDPLPSTGYELLIIDIASALKKLQFPNE